MQYKLEINQIIRDLRLNIGTITEPILDVILEYLNDHLELFPNHQSVLETLEEKENEISNLEEKVYQLELQAAGQNIIKQVPPESGGKKKREYPSPSII